MHEPTAAGSQRTRRTWRTWVWPFEVKVSVS